MDLGSEGVSVYAEAKAEYTKQLCQYLVPSIQQYFLDLLEEAKQKEVDPKKILLMFQTLLEDISEWNVDKVQRETTAIVSGSQCDYLDELMTAVFIAHTKVLSAIRLTTKQKKLQITIPKLEHFLHRTLRECSRLLWSNTYLFSSNSPSIERQKNLRQIENFLHEGVLQGIRGMLPVKNILREYLKEDDSEEDEEEAKEEIKEEVKDVVKDVKEVVKEEVKEEVKNELKEEVKKELKEELKKEVKEEVEEIEEIKKELEASSPLSFTGDDTLITTEGDDDILITDTAAKERDASKDQSEDVTILDTPPEEMDGFEDLDARDELIMDFETLD